MESIVIKLDKLAEFEAQKDVLNMARQDAIDKVMTDEIKAQLAAIDAEFAPKADSLAANKEN